MTNFSCFRSILSAVTISYSLPNQELVAQRLALRHQFLGFTVYFSRLYMVRRNFYV
jgi:hypothetical protein